MNLLERLQAKSQTAAVKVPLADRLRLVKEAPATQEPADAAPKTSRLANLVSAHESKLIQGRNGNMTWSSGVKRTEEFRRILNLPRRVLDWSRNLTHSFRIPGGTLELRPIQSAALWEAYQAKGLLGPIQVGGGKTLIMLLMPLMFKAQRPVVLVKPDLKAQLISKDWPFYGKHFRLPQNVTIVSYSQLSTAKSADVLDRIQPDLIVADEVHSLKSRDAARTKRFLRYMDAHPNTVFVGLSGSITQRSVRDYAHLSKLALKQGSPLPLVYSDLEEWALALDPQPEGMDDPPPGALIDFCAPGEPVRQGFHRRLVETPGVVAQGDDTGEGMSLRLRGLYPKVPQDIKDALKKLRDTWCTPGGEELEDGIGLARASKQLTQGFYYRWDWAKVTEDGEPDREWLDARSAWARAVRGVLRYRSKPGLDSPLFVARAASRGELTPDEQEAWENWCCVKERPTPPTVPVWVSDYLVDHVGERSYTNAIIWYEHTAVGVRIAEKFGWPLFAGGNDSKRILNTEANVIVASIKAHGTGKNLQRYAHGIILSCPSSGSTCQQLLGRQHRPGQEADEVIFDVYLQDESLEASLRKAFDEAAYIAETTGATQKILLASREGIDW